MWSLSRPQPVGPEAEAFPAACATQAETSRPVGRPSEIFARGSRWSGSELFWLLLPVLAGAGLRLFRIKGQILLGDESHSLRMLVRAPLSQILSTYSVSDFCQPLTGFYRLLLDGGVPLSETALRLPVLAFSIATVAVIPWLVRSWIGYPASLLFAWMLAISPQLVLYGRIIRSYSPLVVLALGAALSLYAFTERPGWRTGALSALLAALAVYFHLLAAPLLAVAFGFLIVESLVKGRETEPAPEEGHGAGWPALLAVAAGTAAVTASFLIPAWPSLSKLVAEKRAGLHTPLTAIPDLLRLQSGSEDTALVILFWLAALVGCFALVRRRLRFGLYTLTLAAGHTVAVQVLAPLGLQAPLIVSRYYLLLTPIFLLWISVGLTEPWLCRRNREGRIALLQAFAVVGLPVALLLSGPFADSDFRRSSFQHHSDAIDMSYSRVHLPAESIFGFYLLVAASSGDAPIVEYPATFYAHLWRTPYVYQRHHGRPVISAVHNKFACNDQLALRNTVCARPQDILNTRAEYLVLHLRIAEEERRIEGGHRAVIPQRTEVWMRMRREAKTLASRLRKEWGRPDFAEPGLRVWSLNRVRSERDSRGRRPPELSRRAEHP